MIWEIYIYVLFGQTFFSQYSTTCLQTIYWYTTFFHGVNSYIFCGVSRLFYFSELSPYPIMMPHQISYCNFRVYFTTWKENFCIIIFLFQKLSCLPCICLLYEFWNQFVKELKKNLLALLTNFKKLKDL